MGLLFELARDAFFAACIGLYDQWKYRLRGPRTGSCSKTRWVRFYFYSRNVLLIDFKHLDVIFEKSVLNRLLENQIHSRDDQVVYDGLPGSKLDMTESLSLPHGDIKTRFETFIVGSSEQAIVVAKSTSIEATGNAKLTQAVKLKAHARKKCREVGELFLERKSPSKSHGLLPSLSSSVPLRKVSRTISREFQSFFFGR